ncbi:hypothetical protein F5B21DRAFT_454845 [Xylaria acuta]|nr:hypothetical protein F5B21DRAFT_454845 [Xylaria acuta]
MAVAQRLSLDLLLRVADHLGDRDLLNLGTTQQVLSEPLTRRAFIVALTDQPFNHNLKPVTYAIQNGDIQLLSKVVGFFDAMWPAGWKWSRFYTDGVGRLLRLAAAHNLESLQYLLHKYPLMLGGLVPPNLVPASVLEHGFYSVGNWHAPAVVNIRNWELVIEALKRGKYDCASFLFNYQPPLFPNGFPVRANAICYSSATTLDFLLDHGANLGADPLHHVAALVDIPDTQVFDLLVQRGFGVDSPRETLRDSPTGLMFTPLCEACRSFQPRNVEALLRLGANPNGITGSYSIKKAPLMGGFQYFSPSPILTLLLSPRWGLQVRANLEDFGRALIDCFQSLLHYGATTSMPLLNGDLLEILLLRVWRTLYRQIMNQMNSVLPECPDKPHDLNQGVQSLLLALGRVDVSPWDHVCQAISDMIPTWSGNARQARGKERLIRLLNDYQDKFGDLLGPAQLQESYLFKLPDRYAAQLENSTGEHFSWP